MLTGESIKAVRRVRNIRQVELSKQTGILQPYLSSIEQGIRILTKKQEKAILAALGVTEKQSEELTTIVRHITEAKKLEAECWARLRQSLTEHSV